MQEAFKKALEGVDENTKEVLGRQIQAASQARVEAERIRKSASYIGRSWRQTRIELDRQSPPIERIRMLWLPLREQISQAPLEEGVKTLEDLASGLGITRDRPHFAYTSTGDFFYRLRWHALQYFVNHKDSGVNPTFDSQIFIGAISDLEYHSPEQEKDLQAYVYRGAGLQGRIELPALLPVMARRIAQLPIS